MMGLRNPFSVNLRIISSRRSVRRRRDKMKEDRMKEDRNRMKEDRNRMKREAPERDESKDRKGETT